MPAPLGPETTMGRRASEVDVVGGMVVMKRVGYGWWKVWLMSLAVVEQ